MVALAVAACGPVPPPRLSAFTQLQPGISAIHDAVALLGRPSATTTIAPGQILVQWLDTAAGFRHVAIVFSDDSQMVRLQQVAGL